MARTVALGTRWERVRSWPAAPRRLERVTVQGYANCPHCGALLQDQLCQICGKSPEETVEVAAPPPPESAWARDLDRRQLVMAGASVVGVLLVVATWALLRSPHAPPDPNALPMPSPTTIKVDAEAPTIARPEAPTASAPDPLVDIEVDSAAERAVGGASPWDAPVPVDVLTGNLLPDVDYTAGIEAVAVILATGVAPFELGDPTLLANANDVEFSDAEQTQPFAARGVSLDGAPVADLWLFAAPNDDTDPSSAYVETAIAAWPVDAAIQQYSPEVGVRVWQVADDGEVAVWVEARPRRLVVLWTDSTTDPAILGAVVTGLGTN